MTEAREIANWLRVVADNADMGRKPNPSDRLRIAANILEEQIKEIERLRAGFGVKRFLGETSDRAGLPEEDWHD